MHIKLYVSVSCATGAVGMLYDFYPPNRLLFKDAEVQVTYDPSAFADFDFEYFGDAAPAYLDAELATRLASIDDTVVTE